MCRNGPARLGGKRKEMREKMRERRYGGEKK
jgi:hypothetical protein